MEPSESGCRQTEGRLHEAERRLRAVYEQSLDVIYTLDCNLTVTSVSDSVIRHLGYRPEELVGRPFQETNLIAPESLEAAFEDALHVFAGNTVTAAQYRFYRKDGSTVIGEVSGSPLVEDGKVIGLISIARDITERRRSEENQQENRVLAERLAKEREVIAEIGRVISSSLDINEVYDRFADEVKKLIPFDRLAVNLHDPARGIVSIAYSSGEYIAGRRPGDSFPLKDSVTELLVKTRTGVFSHPQSIEEMDKRFPNHTATVQAGMRSLLSVPLFSRGEVIASLHFRSRKPNVYTEQELRLAEMIGEQIAGAIANAQLFAGLKKAEAEQRRNREKAERLAEEMAVIAEIGRIIGSTLDIEEVYERFVAEARKLIPFDNLMINLINWEKDALEIAYVSGLDIPNRRQGDKIPFQRSFCESIVRERRGMLLQMENLREVIAKYPHFTHVLQAGLRSMMATPLISGDKVIGAMIFRSKEANLYTERLLNIADRIGSQIAGAIANAQLYTGLRKTEQELKESEQRYHELSIVDDLTKLYNSRHFYFQLKIELDRSNRYEQPLALLLLDLDNFKAFNDAYGHVEGDQVLCRLGQVVKRCLRETDFAYRYGGEEFTILLPMTTSAEGAVTAERIRTEFKKEAFSPAPGQEVHMTMSIGLAQYRPQEEMKAFVHRVDKLMYQGKQNGKDRVCCGS